MKFLLLALTGLAFGSGAFAQSSVGFEPISRITFVGHAILSCGKLTPQAEAKQICVENGRKIPVQIEMIGIPVTEQETDNYLRNYRNEYRAVVMLDLNSAVEKAAGKRLSSFSLYPHPDEASMRFMLGGGTRSGFLQFFRDRPLGNGRILPILEEEMVELSELRANIHFRALTEHNFRDDYSEIKLNLFLKRVTQEDLKLGAGK